MTNQELRKIVNNADTHEAVAKAEKILKESDIDNDSYNDMMMTLSYISRELYQM